MASPTAQPDPCRRGYNQEASEVCEGEQDPVHGGEAG